MQSFATRAALNAIRSPTGSIRCSPRCIGRQTCLVSRRLPHAAPCSSQQPNKERPTSSARRGQDKTDHSWIPVGLGVAFLGALQLLKVTQREQEKPLAGHGESASASSNRARSRPLGSWQVWVMSALPLKAASRLWGRLNSLQVPYSLRVPGFRLYSCLFAVELDEMEEPDLHKFPNLAAFFYRKLKPDARPLDPNPAALLSPADGRLLQFGQIEDGAIEQVKGMTYSVDALLGPRMPCPSMSPRRPPPPDPRLEADAEFARVNGIPYTPPGLVSSVSQERADHPHALHYAVIYLAPGDYHRFHAPTNWVVERRRHFAGALYSVSPYVQRTLPGLFTLNERVALLGRWRWGFFGYVPVGATNVGSIKINFDRELRTNSLLTDTAADRAAEDAARRGEPYSGYAEASYEGASPVLHGYALRRGEEMGGFQLGSTIVLVFEAPVGQPDRCGRITNGWAWAVDKGQKVKMGQALGQVQP